MQFRLSHLIIATTLMAILIGLLVWITGIPWHEPKPISFSVEAIERDSFYVSRAGGVALASTPPSDTEYEGPRWNLGELNPPLSVADAIKLAISKKDALVARFPNNRKLAKLKFGIDKAILIPHTPASGYWFWLITFEDQNQDFTKDEHDFFSFVVLMDGTVVEPQVEPNGGGGFF